MLIRAALALLLLLPAAASAQGPDTAVSALVRISGTRGGAPVRGSGFVVGLDDNKATVVTASHVIEGLQKIEVTFAAQPTLSFPVGSVLGLDPGSPNGLAVFEVRGALPPGVTTLSLEIENRPRVGETLLLLGFPQMELTPRTTQRVMSGRRGTLLVVDQEVGEGFSGGPVLLGGKVVGVVTEMDGQTTYAVNAVVVHEALEGWDIKPAPPPLKACVPGEERTGNDIVYVRICAGSFIMGSAASDPQAYADEKPAHQVTLSEFWMGKTEITNKQYRRFRQDHDGEDSLPVANVSFYDAKEACEHFGGRLPTEAEWEYAARAGSQTPWSFGDNVKKLDEYSWCGGNSGNTSHPVGTKKPNAWGLYDMHGNVAEWVADWYGTYPSAEQKDPTGPAATRERVLRGGSFSTDDEPRELRSAWRASNEPAFRGSRVGFRCVQSSHRQP